MHKNFRRFYILFTFFFLLSLINLAVAKCLVLNFVPTDSIGIERYKGESYILHQVDEGETLFALSRKYNADLNIIRQVNPRLNVDQLSIGDTLRIPLFPQYYQGRKTIHSVEEGETLFRLSRTYQVTIENLRRWNSLDGRPLAIGEDIVVYHVPEEKPETRLDEQKYVVHTVRQGETLFAISRAYGVAVNELMQRNRLSDERIAFGQQLVIREREIVATPELPVSASTLSTPTIPEPPSKKIAEEEEDEEDIYDRRLSRSEALAQEKKRIEAIRAAEKKELSEYEKKSELGFAAAIEGGIETQKFLALHRTAPVGTIIQIRNEMNNLSVFVRVVGRLPDTGMNDKVSIRISQAAYEKLGGINERFPVEITYIQ